MDESARTKGIADMTFEETTAARQHAHATILAALVGINLKGLNAREVEIVREILARPWQARQEPEAQPESQSAVDLRREAMAETDRIVDLAVELAAASGETQQ